MSRADPAFPWGFDARFAFGPDDRWTGYFGRVARIDAFHAAKARERRFRVLGSALLGAFMWLDDPELVQRITEFPYACSFSAVT